jgi:HAMP domain-containing protein
LVVGIGKAVVGILAGEVIKGDSHHGVSKRGKVGADVGGGGGGSSEEFMIGVLESAVDVAAEVGEAESSVGKMRERRKRVGRGKVVVREGETGRAEQGALTTGVGLPVVKKDHPQDFRIVYLEPPRDNFS